MRSVLNRLYRTKLVLSCLAFCCVGAVLVTLGRQFSGETGWVSWIPWTEFGGVLIGAGVLSVGLDAYLKREQDTIDELRLRQLFTDQAPAMRDAVLQAFAANHEDLERIATPEMLDQLITNSLALRLKDAQFAAEIYNDIRAQAITAAERWYDASLDIKVTPATGRTKNPDLFSVTVRWEYTTTPTHPQRRFVCLGDREEYAELSEPGTATSAWYINPESGVDASDPDSFELLRFAVDGEERAIRRTSRKNAQAYSVSVGSDAIDAQEPVTVSYTYRVLMARSGHLLFFDIEQPTRDLRASFDYTGCDMASVSTLDMVPSIRPTRIEVPEDPQDDRIVRVDLDGWIFPRSGIAFVWTLEDEATGARRHSGDQHQGAHTRAAS